ncbi:MAG: GTP-binding protein TypA/BipA, partial [Phycisphaerales bacterium]|nr:GTP-binding protein TypA/BipA [Phycisphaerales bacterium]
DNREGQVHLEFTIPARGLIGLRTRMLTATQGTAIMHHNFHEYAPARGDVPGRANGVMISMSNGSVNAFALNNLQQRGTMFVEPTQEVYEGMIVAENARDNDMPVNPTTAKKLSNMRTTSSDENIILKPARKLTLEQALEYIEDDELVEATPSNIRMRKQLLTENARKKAGRSKTVEMVEA